MSIEVDLSQGRAVRTGRFRKRRKSVGYDKRAHKAWIEGRQMLAKLVRQRKAKR